MSAETIIGVAILCAKMAKAKIWRGAAKWRRGVSVHRSRKLKISTVASGIFISQLKAKAEKQ
jgi:hypothetical protein